MFKLSYRSSIWGIQIPQWLQFIFLSETETIIFDDNLKVLEILNIIKIGQHRLKSPVGNLYGLLLLLQLPLEDKSKRDEIWCLSVLLLLERGTLLKTCLRFARYELDTPGGGVKLRQLCWKCASTVPSYRVVTRTWINWGKLFTPLAKGNRKERSPGRTLFASLKSWEDFKIHSATPPCCSILYYPSPSISPLDESNICNLID